MTLLLYSNRFRLRHHDRSAHAWGSSRKRTSKRAKGGLHEAPAGVKGLPLGPVGGGFGPSFGASGTSIGGQPFSGDVGTPKGIDEAAPKRHVEGPVVNLLNFGVKDRTEKKAKKAKKRRR